MTCHVITRHTPIDPPDEDEQLMSDGSDNQGVPDRHQHLTSSLGGTEERLTAHEEQFKELTHMFKCMMKVLEATQVSQAETTRLQSGSDHRTDCHDNDNKSEGNDNTVPQPFPPSAA